MRLPQFCAGLAGGIALLAWVGWLVNARFLAGQGAIYIPMAPSTALGFLLLGSALFSVGRWPMQRLSQCLALTAVSLVLVLGLLVLAQFATGIDSGVERALARSIEWLGPVPLGRMSPLTASSFLLEGAALLLLLLPQAWRHGPGAAALLAVIATAVNVVMLVGYAYGVPLLYGGRIIPVAWPTALAFVVLGIGQIKLSMPRSAALRAWGDDSLRSRLLRAFLPVTLLLILIQGWIDVTIKMTWLPNPAVWHSMTALVACGTIVAITGWIARHTADSIDEAQAKVRESEKRYRGLFETSHDAIMTLEPPAWKFTSCNRATVEMFGAKNEAAIVSLGPWDVSPERQPDGRLSGDDSRQAIETAVREGSHFFEWTHKRIDGMEFPATVLMTRMERDGKTIVQATVRNITEQKRGEDELRQANSHLAQLNEELELAAAQVKGLMNDVVARNVFTKRFANPSLLHCWEAKKCNSTTCPSHRNHKNLRCWEVAGTFCGGKPQGKFAQKLGDCSRCEVYQRARANPVMDMGETFNTMVAILEDRNRELKHASFHDTLTGLPNRALFCDRLQQAVRRCKREEGRRFAVLFLDFDRFKIINDSLGHQVGDLLLKEIAARLHAVMPRGDSPVSAGYEHTTARLGGDEFVVLLDGIQRPGDATAVADRLLDAFSQPYRLGDHEVYSTASIGIVTSDTAAQSAEGVLRDADTAMYEAKLAGKGRYVLFDVSMHDRVQNRLGLENDLRKAIDAGQLFLMYQPIVSLDTGEVAGCEALLRWQHPERGMISPGEFIPIAEDTGMIVPIGEWVLREACRQFAQWRRSMGDAAPRSINVNLSRNQILLADLPAMIRQILDETGVPPACLHLEITESAVMRDVELATSILHAIKQIGAKLDMDDFGTGYSSLACLQQFPIDVLKIDRSFVANINRGRDFAALVHAVAQLARNLGISVVAEGIETVDQALVLQSLDCEFGQGYLFARPMMAEQIVGFKVQAGLLPGQSIALAG